MPHPDAPRDDDKTLTAELGSEGGSGAELRQTDRAQRAERAPLGPPLLLVVFMLLIAAALVWFLVAVS